MEATPNDLLDEALVAILEYIVALVGGVHISHTPVQSGESRQPTPDPPQASPQASPQPRLRRWSFYISATTLQVADRD